MATIVFTELEGWEEPYLKDKLPGHELRLLSHPPTAADWLALAEAEVVSPFIYTYLKTDELERLPKLKFIATRSTGFDHIDVAAAKSRGVAVANVPFYGENTVAEHTWALILALSRKILQSYERTERGNFQIDESLRGFDLKEKTLGVIGCGHIGQHVVRIAKAFEMNVLVFDAKPNPALAQELGFTYVSLDTLLKEADVITLHAPYMPATHHLLNAENMKLIKKGAVLVNTARGGLVDTQALVKALENGTLSGAGLDVLEEECNIREEGEVLSTEFHKSCDLKTLIADHVLLSRDDVIITPHNAFNSKEAIVRILDTTVANIQAYL
ncbi:MAG: hydroxyacid dehydrogenase, partial [Candidatus Veblenbacteria bacterium]|nr:hydroxyacid dehydrogenase [Candidatus Veblenbacteria bacterium]